MEKIRYSCKRADHSLETLSISNFYFLLIWYLFKQVLQSSVFATDISCVLVVQFSDANFYLAISGIVQAKPLDITLSLTKALDRRS